MQLACSVSTNVGRQAEHPTFSSSYWNRTASFSWHPTAHVAENPEKASRSVRKIALLQSFQAGAEVRRMCHWWTLMTWARAVAMV